MRDNANMPRLELFPFRHRDPRTGKWTRARYRAELREIAARFAEFEIIGRQRFATSIRMRNISRRTSRRRLLIQSATLGLC